jgi:hypothetical protein
MLFKKKKLNGSTPIEIEHKGERHAVSKYIQESQGTIEGRCFV